MTFLIPFLASALLIVIYERRVPQDAPERHSRVGIFGAIVGFAGAFSGLLAEYLRWGNWELSVGPSAFFGIFAGMASALWWGSLGMTWGWSRTDHVVPRVSGDGSSGDS